jgi:hypothetical protein
MVEAYMRWKGAVDALREAEERPNPQPEEVERLRREEQALLKQVMRTMQEQFPQRRSRQW